MCFCRNDEEEEERPERQEKGTKVKRTLSSLRSRMTGSFNKDKVIKHTLTSFMLGLCFCRGIQSCSFLQNFTATSVSLQLPPFLECTVEMLNWSCRLWGSFNLFFKTDNVPIVDYLLKINK